jgi:hypothetical protein
MPAHGSVNAGNACQFDRPVAISQVRADGNDFRDADTLRTFDDLQ